jgi:TRAP-type C4-dicarboxylate transport system permease small subunit
MNSQAVLEAPALPWLDRFVMRPLLLAVDVTAGLLLAADLVVVCMSVLYRYGLNAPLEWSDDVARGLMVALSFFGAAAALARGDNVGIAFFADRLRSRTRLVVDAMGSLLVAITAGSVAMDALQMGVLTTGQTMGSGLPLEWSFYPMGAAGVCMAVFALDRLRRLHPRDLAIAVLLVGLIAAWPLPAC